MDLMWTFRCWVALVATWLGISANVAHAESHISEADTCLPTPTFDDDAGVDMDAYRFNMRLLRRLLLKIIPAKDYCNLMLSLREIHIVNAPHFIDSYYPNTNLVGLYEGNLRRITVCNDMGALFHELLHHYEWPTLPPTTDECFAYHNKGAYVEAMDATCDHHDWDKRGWFDISAWFHAHTKRVSF